MDEQRFFKYEKTFDSEIYCEQICKSGKRCSKKYTKTLDDGRKFCTLHYNTIINNKSNKTEDDKDDYQSRKNLYCEKICSEGKRCSKKVGKNVPYGTNLCTQHYNSEQKFASNKRSYEEVSEKHNKEFEFMRECFIFFAEEKTHADTMHFKDLMIIKYGEIAIIYFVNYLKKYEQEQERKREEERKRQEEQERKRQEERARNIEKSFQKQTNILKTVNTTIQNYQLFELEYPKEYKDFASQFRKLSLKYHPDKNRGNNELTEKFKELNRVKQELENIYCN